MMAMRTAHYFTCQSPNDRTDKWSFATRLLCCTARDRNSSKLFESGKTCATVQRCPFKWLVRGVPVGKWLNAWYYLLTLCLLPSVYLFSSLRLFLLLLLRRNENVCKVVLQQCFLVWPMLVQSVHCSCLSLSSSSNVAQCGVVRNASQRRETQLTSEGEARENSVNITGTYHLPHHHWSRSPVADWAERSFVFKTVHLLAHFRSRSSWHGPVKAVWSGCAQSKSHDQQYFWSKAPGSNCVSVKSSGWLES